MVSGAVLSPADARHPGMSVPGRMSYIDSTSVNNWPYANCNPIAPIISVYMTLRTGRYTKKVKTNIAVRVH